MSTNKTVTPAGAPTAVMLSLSSLLPTHPFPPEPELTALATSLLAQSRHLAPHLKANEEVARTFACAHIACGRLANRLHLDVVRERDVKPPVPLRVYVRLKAFLERTLQRTAAVTLENSTERYLPSATTSAASPAPPSVLGKRRARAPTATSATGDADGSAPSTPAPPGRSPEKAANGGFDLTMPLIRRICTACRLPTAVPHVFTGATVVAREIGSRSSNGISLAPAPASRGRRRTGTTPSQQPQAAQDPAEEATATGVPAGVLPAKWPALLTAMFVLTAAKMRGEEVDDPQLKPIKETAIEQTERYLREHASELPFDVAAVLGPKGTGGMMARTVGFYLLEAEDCGWLAMEWYENIPSYDPEATGGDEKDDEQGDDMNDVEDDIVKLRRRRGQSTQQQAQGTPSRRAMGDNDGEDRVGAAGLLPGLATMFQPSIDWLSEERQADYVIWRRGLLNEISEVESRG